MFGIAIELILHDVEQLFGKTRKVAPPGSLPSGPLSVTASPGPLTSRCRGLRDLAVPLAKLG